MIIFEKIGYIWVYMSRHVYKIIIIYIVKYLFSYNIKYISI